MEAIKSIRTIGGQLFSRCPTRSFLDGMGETLSWIKREKNDGNRTMYGGEGTRTLMARI